MVPTAGVDAPDESERERQRDQMRPAVDERAEHHEVHEPVGPRRVEPTHGLVVKLSFPREHAEDSREVDAEREAQHT